MLKEKIYADMVAAMKSRSPELDTLRMLKAEIMKYEVSGKDMTATDEVVVDLLKKAIKQRKEAAEGFTKGGNQAAAEKELSEITMIEKYLPAQLSEDEVRQVVQEVIGQMNAGPADFGKVMGMVMSKLKGQTDGDVVSKVVKELLG